jgi:phospholipid-binding lipoprotein MlaA
LAVNVKGWLEAIGRLGAVGALVSLGACAGGHGLLPPSTASLAPPTTTGTLAAPAAMPQPSFLAKAPDAAAPAGSVAANAADPGEVLDPLETMNRSVFDGNQSFNHAIVYPAAKAYRDTVPENVRDRIDAFSTNLSEPMVFANDVIQLRPGAALTTLARFVTNSTVGLGGLFDVAASVGQKHQSGDFGQTLYVWGVRESPYVVLPVVGPTNLRDAFGTGAEMVIPSAGLKALPTRFAELTEFGSNYQTVDAFGKPVAGLGKVEMLEELEASSLDFYAMLRSMADQKRQSELREALATSLLTAPTLEATKLLPEPATTKSAAPAKPSSSVVIGIPRESP